MMSSMDAFYVVVLPLFSNCEPRELLKVFSEKLLLKIDKRYRFSPDEESTQAGMGDICQECTCKHEVTVKNDASNYSEDGSLVEGVFLRSEGVASFRRLQLLQDILTKQECLGAQECNN